MENRPPLRAERHRSVFLKLLATMVAQALVVMVMVGGFFSYVLAPSLLSSMDGITRESAVLLAATSPDHGEAMELADRLDLKIRYQGPEGGWATDPGLPAISEIPAGQLREGWEHRSVWPRDYEHRSVWPRYYVVAGPEGGIYLFAWSLRDRTVEIHNTMVVLLLVLLAGVMLTAYVFMRQALKPLRLLHEGVSKLSEGNLEVVVPQKTRDELGALTAAFNEMVRRVADMVRARDQLLVDVSHELRSPITRIKVALEFIPDSEKKRRLVADVAEIETMITEILEIERLAAGSGLRLERTDLVDLLGGVVEGFAGREPGVVLRRGSEELVLEMDAARVRTVVKNVLENALKFSRPESEPVQISVEEADGSVEVRIRDDGPGIPSEDLASLFEPFFRVDRSRSRRTGGYGLGLAMSRRIMQAHGGTITAENNPTQGTTFTLMFRRGQV